MASPTAGSPQSHHGFVTDPGSGGCAGASPSTPHVGTTDRSGPTWGERLEEQISKVGPAKPPLPYMGSCPSPEHPWGGGAQEPLSCLLAGTHTPLAFAVIL